MAQKKSKAGDNINSRLALVMKSGKGESSGIERRKGQQDTKLAE
jgi:hypothetical protein